MDKPLFGNYVGRIRKGLRREFEARAATLDITISQYQVLRRLWQGDGVATSVLTQDSGSDGGTITGIIDRLEARALIRRERVAEDRRTVRVWLTPAGSALKEPLMAIIIAINEEAMAGLGDRRRGELIRDLEKVARNLEV